MRANVIFPNVTAYNVYRFDVRLGEVFRVKLVAIPPGLPIDWLASHDPVLAINDNGSDEAEITATEVGTSEIQLENRGHLLLTLNVKVYAAPEEPAKTLKATVGVPEQQ